MEGRRGRGGEGRGVDMKPNKVKGRLAGIIVWIEYFLRNPHLDVASLCTLTLCSTV